MPKTRWRRRKPRIGVTGPDQGAWPAWFLTKVMIWWYGGRALRITPGCPRGLDGLCGLVIGGGADIHPSRYREEILSTIRAESRHVHRRRGRFLLAILLWLVRKVFSVEFTNARNDVRRDDLEFRLLREAVQRQMPVLGICRGGQLINVFFGGTLYQDIQSFYVERPNLRTIRPRKLVHVAPGTTLSRILGQPNALVNSLHRQSMKDIGKGLRVAATEPNGVVQAVEHRQLPFLLGVQWHPEFLPLNREQRGLWRHFVEASSVHGLAGMDRRDPLRAEKLEPVVTQS
ncbi:MAG: gamma-glutamyl-gamma-aminobutyrate hydrolase family protein [Bdellovibrionales bacterium]